MDNFDILTMIGGLCLFLFGMNIMGESLERAAGNSLRTLLGKLTGNRLAGFLTGLAVTAVIQSSSATTVMVVGFVNSGLLKLSQAVGVIMGANVGTTVTAWILSLSGVEGDSLFLQLLKPSNFTPILALLGIIYYMFIKDSKKKDIGDLERIGDHSLNLVEAAQELKEKKLACSDNAPKELSVLIGAVEEIVGLSFRAFRENDLQLAYQVEPLEQVIDELKEQMRLRHILRLQQGGCSIETGFIWSDLLTGLERIGDHCSIWQAASLI